MGYIYKITNKINGMVYVGQTTKQKPTDRFSQHRYLARHPEQEKHASYLHRAMAKYGVDNFSFEVLEEVRSEDLNDREQYWIKSLNCLSPNGYNLTIGGDGTQGFARPQTVEEKIKRQQSNKKFYVDHPEARKEASERTKELWKDNKFREKVTKGIHAFYDSHPDMFKGEKNPFYGKHHTEENLEKIRIAAKKRQLPIAQLNKDTLEIIKIYNGVKEAERTLGVSHGWLSKAAKLGKVAYGYRWKFLQKV